mgnify:CR=1 FL=1
MSKRITVTIDCKQTIHFKQDVELHEEEYEKLKELNYDDVTERHNKEQYNIIESYIDYNSFAGSDYEFKDVSVKPSKNIK